MKQQFCRTYCLHVFLYYAKFNSSTTSTKWLSMYIYIYICISTSMCIVDYHTFCVYFVSSVLHICVCVSLINLSGFALRENRASIHNISIVATCFPSLNVHIVKHNSLAWIVLAAIKRYCNVRCARAAYVPVHHVLYLDRRFLEICSQLWLDPKMFITMKMMTIERFDLIQVNIPVQCIYSCRSILGRLWSDSSHYPSQYSEI